MIETIPLTAFNLYPQCVPPVGALCLVYDLVRGTVVYDICRFVRDEAGVFAFVNPVLPNLSKKYPNAWIQLKER